MPRKAILSGSKMNLTHLREYQLHRKKKLERIESQNPPKIKLWAQCIVVTLLTKMVRESASSVGGPVLRKPACTKHLDNG